MHRITADMTNLTGMRRDAFIGIFGEQGMEVDKENLITWMSSPCGSFLHLYGLVNDEQKKELRTVWKKPTSGYFVGGMEEISELFVELYMSGRKITLVDKMIRQALR